MRTDFPDILAKAIALGVDCDYRKMFHRAGIRTTEVLSKSPSGRGTIEVLSRDGRIKAYLVTLDWTSNSWVDALAPVLVTILKVLRSRHTSAYEDARGDIERILRDSGINERELVQKAKERSKLSPNWEKIPWRSISDDMYEVGAPDGGVYAVPADCVTEIFCDTALDLQQRCEKWGERV